MKTARQRLGAWGEEQAAGYLTGQGYLILDRNARTRYGEIDLVARDPGRAVTVFIEVKTRRSDAFGLPESAVDTGKQAHLLASAQAYLQAHPGLEGDWRLDVIAIRRKPGQEAPEIVHFENAFTEC